MENPTTYDSTAEKINYEAEVDKGLHELDKLLQKIELNQAETAQIRKETKIIAARIDKLMKEF
jgi:cell division protein FtsB